MKKFIISMTVGAMLIFCGSFAQAREETKDIVDKQARRRGTRPERKVIRPVSEKNEQPGAVDRTRPIAARERIGRQSRDVVMGRRLVVIQKQVEQKRKVHEAFIGQLKAIKNQAEKEGAKKTIAMLNNLIVMEEKKTAESVNKLEKDREKITGQIEKYKQSGKVRPAEEKKAEVKKAEGAKPAEAAKPAEGEKKKKKWWKFGKD